MLFDIKKKKNEWQTQRRQLWQQHGMQKQKQQQQRDILIIFAACVYSEIVFIYSIFLVLPRNEKFQKFKHKLMIFSLTSLLKSSSYH